MIKFIEHSETKLKFVSYSLTTLFSYLVVLVLSSLIVVYFAYFSPIKSSLYCQKNLLNQIDCQLQERSLLNFQLTKIDIVNLKQVEKYPSLFGSRDSRIKLKANPRPLAFNAIGFQKKYFFPSNPFSLVLFRYFNTLNWFEPASQIDTIDRFIQGKLNQKSILIQQSLQPIDVIFPGLFIFVFAIIPINIIVDICFALSFKSTYEFNQQNQFLTIQQRKLFGQVEKQYSFNRIKQVKLDTEYRTNFNQGRIILEFNPSYDYPIDEFANVEQGTENFQLIKNFLED